MVEVKLTIEVKCCYPANSQELFDEINQALINNSNFDEVHIWGYQDNIGNSEISHRNILPISQSCTCGLSGGLDKNEACTQNGEVE